MLLCVNLDHPSIHLLYYIKGAIGDLVEASKRKDASADLSENLRTAACTAHGGLWHLKVPRQDPPEPTIRDELHDIVAFRGRMLYSK